MTSKSENPVVPKYMRLRVVIILLCTALVGTSTMLVWGMVHYRLPGFFWKRVSQISEPIPALDISTAYHITPVTAALGFNRVVSGETNFARWQQQGKAKLRELLNPISSEVMSLRVRMIASERVGTVTRETLVFSQSDGVDVPAFLLRPDVDVVRPGVLVVPGHSQGIVATAGIVQDYQHANALRIAEAGYVVLTMEVRGFGYLGRMTHNSDLIVLDSYVAFTLTHGQTAIGVVIGDLMTGISYLTSRVDVDASKISVVGFSSGGKAAIYLAALDERVGGVVASGCVTDYDHNFLHSRHDAYEAIPRLARWLSFSDCMGLVAPRAMLVHWGRLDTNVFQNTAAFNDGSMPTYDAAKRIYKLAGANDSLQYQMSETIGHEFDPAVAEIFLKKTLPIKP